MEESDLINLLSQPTWSQLDARLRDAVARNPGNAPFVDAIRLPITTLLQLASEVVPVLKGDPLAAERMRATLQAASHAVEQVPLAALVKVLEDANASLEVNEDTRVESAKVGDFDREPGLLRLRPFALLAIAAALAQRQPQHGRFAMLVLAGLALKCGPAEVLARLEPYGARDKAYDNLLRLSVPPGVADSSASTIYMRLDTRDPVERARWKCIIEVIKVVERLSEFQPRPTLVAVALLARPADAPPPASTAPTTTEPPATTEPPTTTEPPPPTTNRLLQVESMSRPLGAVWSIANADGITSVARNKGFVEISGRFNWTEPFPADRVRVVGYRADNPPVIGEVVQTETDPQTKTLNRLIVKFDFSDVLWVGFNDRDRIERANELREYIRGLLDEVQRIPCLGAESDFQASILPNYSATEWPTTEEPPRTASNQVPPTSTPNVPPRDPFSTGGERVSIVMLPVATASREDPAPPSQEELAKSLQTLGRRIGTSFDVVTLPWVEDAGAVISSMPTGDDDPRVGGLLEVLARAAARTPGRENALWVAVVPGNADVGVCSTADAARGVGVATRAGLTRCVSEMLDEPSAEAASIPTRFNAGRLQSSQFRSMAMMQMMQLPMPRRTRPPASRLRVIGRLSGTTLEILEPPREEIRGAGRGAPEDTGVVAVALDRAGAELARSPIRAHRDTLPATFAALIPVSPEIDVVELRRGVLVLARIERAIDPPNPAQVELDTTEDGRVTATWSMPNASRPITLTVELSALGEGDDWVPFTTLHGCSEVDLLPLWRSAGARRVRLVACDGWAAIPGDPAEIPEGATFGPVVIRRVNERTLWAEVPSSAGDVDWDTDVLHRETGRRLDIVSTAGGPVRLSALLGEEFTLSDSIDLGERDAYRRA